MSNLVLEVKLEEAVIIKPNIRVSVAKIGKTRVKLLIQAPREVEVIMEKLIKDGGKVA